MDKVKPRLRMPLRDVWKQSLPRRIALVDAICIISSLLIAQVGKFGTSTTALVGGTLNANYSLLSALLGLAWWSLLHVSKSRDLRVIGTGTDEFKQVTRASLFLFGGLAIVSYVFDLQPARGYVAIALPTGLCLLLLGRFILRKALHGARRRGQYMRRIALVGSPSSVAHLCRSLISVPYAGYVPVAAILPGFSRHSPSGEELPVPVISSGDAVEEIISAVADEDIDAIAISAGSHLKPRVIRQLGWKLQDLGISMIMAPALTDVAGPRMHTQPLAGLPLIHVSTPKLEGSKAFVKRLFDLVGSGGITLLLSPLFLIIAALVKLGSEGPILYSQIRIGQNGEEFRMFKFRSMILNADEQLKSLLERQGTNDQPLFKVENDPRITRVGRFIRQYSLDELPQLLNVLNGTMSLVGPRPQRDSEVALYDEHAHRRLLVKPGMSGLWQVSGRSNLSWEQAIRLDLMYVENWSLIGDVLILLKTFSAVVQKDGAV